MDELVCIKKVKYTNSNEQDTAHDHIIHGLYLDTSQSKINLTHAMQSQLSHCNNNIRVLSSTQYKIKTPHETARYHDV